MVVLPYVCWLNDSGSWTCACRLPSIGSVCDRSRVAWSCMMARLGMVAAMRLLVFLVIMRCVSPCNCVRNSALTVWYVSPPRMFVAIWYGKISFSPFGSSLMLGGCCSLFSR